MFLWTQVGIDYIIMGAGSVDCVTDVHEKEWTLPAEAGLDIRAREVSLVEKVGSGDLDGVGGPLFEACVIFDDMEDHWGAVLEMICH